MNVLIDSLLAAVLVLAVGVPCVALFEKAQKEMDEDGEE